MDHFNSKAKINITSFHIKIKDKKSNSKKIRLMSNTKLFAAEFLLCICVLRSAVCYVGMA